MTHLGISGPIGAGKTTLANQLIQHFDARKIPFATGVYALASYEFVDNRLGGMTQYLVSYGVNYTAAFISASMIDGYMTRFPSTPGIKNRRLLQFIGTEAGRDIIYKDVWIDIVKQQPPHHMIISDDVRFDNEADAVDIHIGIVPTECYAARKAGLGDDYTFSDHASEQSLTREPDLLIPACWSDMDFFDLVAIITVALEY